MWRDIWQYARALWKHWASLLAGPTVTVVLLVWQVFEQANIPEWVFWVIAAPGVPVAGFLAWREEHAKVAPKPLDPEMEWRRPQFQKILAALRPPLEAVLRHVAQVGDCDAVQLHKFLAEQGVAMSTSEADMLLTTLFDAALLEVKAKGNAYGRYAVKPVWGKLVLELAAPPTPTDIRTTDKARELRRQLAASFEEWPPDGPQTFADLVRWAHKVARGYKVTKPGLQELLDLRAEASPHVRDTVGSMRDHYEAAADIINPVLRRTWEQWETDPADSAAVTASLRRAVGLVRQSLAALDTLTKGG